MSEFLQYVLWQFRNSLLLVLLAGVAAAAVLGVAWVLHKRKYKGQKKFPWGKVILWLIFLGYTVIVIYATMLRWSGFFHREWNFYLFRAWREAWNNFSAKNWANVLLNIAMFCPLGFLLPLLGKKFRKWYVTIPTGFGASLAIELLQLAMGRGICDVDDLFCNSLGAAMGYFAVMAFLSCDNEKGKRIKPVLSYLCLALAPVIAVAGIFGAYQVKEYGNLPEAAAYRVNLDHLEWKLDCELSDFSVNVPVYRTRTMSKADCDAFAEEMAALTGQEVAMVSYYQEMAYYNLTRGIMMVYYHDSSYEFGTYGDDMTQWDILDRETVEKALELYSIQVPEAADFRSEGEGWYSFTCDAYVDGAVMLDGVLRVRCGPDDAVQQIENHLISYTYYGEVPVITAQDAYAELKSGDFLYADALKRHSSDSVTVISCILDYEIDTKGFYQPVYIFEICIPETGNTDLVMIPAMK